MGRCIISCFTLHAAIHCRTSADLFKTAFDLVSVTVFVGRFDMRMMQV